jgi:hypothetical protein
MFPEGWAVSLQVRMKMGGKPYTSDGHTLASSWFPGPGLLD